MHQQCHCLAAPAIVVLSLWNLDHPNLHSWTLGGAQESTKETWNAVIRTMILWAMNGNDNFRIIIYQSISIYQFPWVIWRVQCSDVRHLSNVTSWIYRRASQKLYWQGEQQSTTTWKNHQNSVNLVLLQGPRWSTAERCVESPVPNEKKNRPIQALPGSQMMLTLTCPNENCPKICKCMEGLISLHIHIIQRLPVCCCMYPKMHYTIYTFVNAVIFQT